MSCASIGAATWLAMTSAVAPGIARADRSTCGGASSGYCSIGDDAHRDRAGQHEQDRDDRRQDRPVDEEVREHRATSSRVRGGAAGGAAAARAGSDDRHRLAGHDLQHAVDDDAIARLQGPARTTMSVSPTIVADHDRTHLRDTVRVRPRTTRWPLLPCCTASCGTTIAFGRIAPCTIAVTNMPGRSSSLGLGSTARTRNEPVSWLNDGSAEADLAAIRIDSTSPGQHDARRRSSRSWAAPAPPS